MSFGCRMKEIPELTHYRLVAFDVMKIAINDPDGTPVAGTFAEVR